MMVLAFDTRSFLQSVGQFSTPGMTVLNKRLTPEEIATGSFSNTTNDSPFGRWEQLRSFSTWLNWDEIKAAAVSETATSRMIRDLKPFDPSNPAQNGTQFDRTNVALVKIFNAHGIAFTNRERLMLSRALDNAGRGRQ